jgi:beta-lactam-binding protein with PASTA domain
MRFLLGVLLGYSMRGKKTLLITVLTIGAIALFILLPTLFLSGLYLSDQSKRLKSPAQVRVPSIKGLSYENAEKKLRDSDLKIRVLLTRHDLPLQPNLVLEQSPQAGEEVIHGYPVAVTVTKKDPDKSGP